MRVQERAKWRQGKLLNILDQQRRVGEARTGASHDGGEVAAGQSSGRGGATCSARMKAIGEKLGQRPAWGRRVGAARAEGGAGRAVAAVSGGGDRRLSPDLPRGTVNLIGGDLDVDDPRLRTNRTPQSLHHCSVGYHPCHTNDLATKAYPCKRNQKHKQEQEMQSNRLDYEMGSHKPMNGDTV
jgi:hypothetical protein